MHEVDSWDENETERIPISALEHYSYCPRQCGLIHIEQTFDENIYTLRGHLAHERVDTVMTRTERAVRVERALPLWSVRLGLVGRADVVEFYDATPYPVEYKVGKQREWEHEAIQLCAQALCLEEMLGVPVPAGAIYYCTSRTRREITFDAALREHVEAVASATRQLLQGSALPAAPNDTRCKKCSLLDSCLPDVVVRPGRLRWYKAKVFAQMVDDATDTEV
jgi:CRISPR-associated exonuclease Cas4